MNTKRLFVAVELPVELQQKAYNLCVYFMEQYPFRGKCVLPEHMHVTCKFLGNIKHAQLEMVHALLSQIQFHSFRIKTGELGVFQSGHLIKILYLMLQSQSLVELSMMIDAVLEPIVAKEVRSFIPHVTLARIKYVEEKEQFLNAVKRSSLEPIEFQVQEFVLMESTLNREGPEYSTLFHYPLAK